MHILRVETEVQVGTMWQIKDVVIVHYRPNFRLLEICQSPLGFSTHPSWSVLGTKLDLLRYISEMGSKWPEKFSWKFFPRFFNVTPTQFLEVSTEALESAILFRSRTESVLKVWLQIGIRFSRKSKKNQQQPLILPIYFRFARVSHCKTFEQKDFGCNSSMPVDPSCCLCWPLILVWNVLRYNFRRNKIIAFHASNDWQQNNKDSMPSLYRAYLSPRLLKNAFLLINSIADPPISETYFRKIYFWTMAFSGAGFCLLILP